MRRKTIVRVILAFICFVYAGMELRSLLQGPGNYAWEDLFSVFIFTALGLLYIFIILKQRGESPS